ncbi:MAG: hypothetical protein KIT25_15855 [Enhydrobacter sp.]|nr:MAG: hypothetical protein KIT25_15855 [Enhydrobacter sp.]
MALLGVCAAASPAQAQNVTAFNPYNGVGLPGGPQTAIPGTVAPAFIDPPSPAAGGLAFNPWRPATLALTPQSAGPASAPVAPLPYDYRSYQPYDSALPAPPPGPIRSRIVAVPEIGEPRGKPRARTTPQVAETEPPPTPAVTTHAATTTPPAPTPPPVVSVVPATAAPPPAATTSSPPPRLPTTEPPPQPPQQLPRAMAAVAPPPRETAPPPTPPAPRAPPIATLIFSPQSAEITVASRAELERVAKSLNGIRHIELRAFAAGPDPADARKVALARALAVRSYLIDIGVKARIEIGANAAQGNSGPSERVDILTPTL